MAQSLEDLVRQSGDLLKEIDWNDLLTAVGAIVEGTATLHVDPGDSVSDAVAALPAAGGEIALGAGTHELPATLEINSRSRISLTGAGAATIVRCATSEAAIVLTDCHETTLSRLRVEGGTASGPAARHINGAVTVIGGSDVTVSECTLACPDGGAPRGQACLTARGGSDGLRADRCRFEIGAWQTGALVVDPVAVTLDRNHAFLRAGAPNVADAGIVVAGANVGTVRVLDNVIESVTRGIHVGVSGPPAADGTPPAADLVLISGNVITVHIPAGFTRDRHAIFVGNARSISILDTVATASRPVRLPGPIVTPTPTVTRAPLGPVVALTRTAPVEGIRVHGSFGPFLNVRGSSLRNFNVGVRVVPLAAPSIATWVVSETLAEGAAQAVDAPGTVEQQHNRPEPPVLKPGTPVNVLLTPAVASSAVNAVQKITATVTDLNRLRVPSATVRFSVAGANQVAESGLTTDQNGEATFSYTPAKAGTDTVLAYADINRDGKQNVGEPFATATNTAIAPDPATIALDNTSIASAVGTAVTLKATVRDAAAAPVPSFAVHFTVTGANPAADSAVNSDANGVATFSYTGTNQGLDTVRAVVSSQAGERSATATVTYLAPVPTKVVVSPAQGFAFKGQSLTFTATVLDAAGLPRGDASVVWRATGANTAGATAKTNAQGQATFTYPGTNAGTDSITAFADVNNNGRQDVTDPFTTASATFRLQEAERVLVPSLIGLTTTEAAARLQDARLTLGTVTRASISMTALRISSQNPAAGAQVNPGSAVNVTVSGGIVLDPSPLPRPPLAEM